MSNKRPDIKCIIFDFGRVIGSFDHMRTCRRLTEFCNLSAEKIYDLIFKSGLEKQYDEGLTFTEFYTAVKKATSANDNFTEEIFVEIWGDIFSDNPGIENVLEKIKPEIKMMLLSNTNNIHWNYISQLEVMKRFFSSPTQLVLSFQVGARKPDTEIFLEGIKKSGCKPEEIVYVDDIPEYVEVFKKLGGNGIVYDCRTMPPQVLENELAKFNVFSAK